jgi:hypothetical protein
METKYPNPRIPECEGRKGDPAQLPEDFRSVEGPNHRKPLKEVATDSYPLTIKR